MNKLFLFFLISILLLPVLTHAECSCDADQEDFKGSRAIPLKLAAMFSILVAGFLGVCIPTLGKWIPAIRPENINFFIIKAFAAGVILATGFIHILPDAFENLTSPCLNQSPWQDFPFAGFFAMVAAIGTLIIDTVATGYYNRTLNGKVVQELIQADEEDPSQLHVHTHATHGHAHGIASSAPQDGQDLLRRRVISQVLEMGIVVHSVIIGISLGASDSPSTIKPLVIALSFHQCFEGMGLGGCLVQAQFKIREMITMIIFFSLTLPAGIAIGIGISSVYNENSPTALIVEGILNSGAAGILIYMALVDLLAADFMNPMVQKNVCVQIKINISLLVGAGFMSLLAKWA
ncbi:zinc transporter 8-like [Phalaenopsis equestris]|uniref:zinc transporter 8-like n=1 Tax=Phalaenopsis equestris TaxID=78828 RepID=UPI0009E5CFA9|nr:zinc transporter 8-like [Phalaenopsis equestris]